MSSTRRDFVRQSAAAAAGAVAGIPIEAISQGTVPQAGSAQLTWSKAPCRFCGTGCGARSTSMVDRTWPCTFRRSHCASTMPR